MILRAPAVALACDEVGATFQVAHEAVQGRDARTTRPWLAGMLRANRCAVIDIAAPPALAARPIRRSTERLARNLQFAELARSVPDFWLINEDGRGRQEEWVHGSECACGRYHGFPMGDFSPGQRNLWHRRVAGAGGAAGIGDFTGAGRAVVRAGHP